MEQKEIVEGNTLIIESPFSSEADKRVYAKSKINDWRRVFQDEMAYHKDWNKLMPVVEKIHDECKLFSGGLKFFDGLTIFSPITQVWEAVIAFIKWYNTHSPKRSGSGDRELMKG